METFWKPTTQLKLAEAAQVAHAPRENQGEMVEWEALLSKVKAEMMVFPTFPQWCGERIHFVSIDVV